MVTIDLTKASSVSVRPRFWAVAKAVWQKDLRIEFRARVLIGQVIPFGFLTIILFAFALDPDRGLLARVAPGLFWVSVLLAMLLAIGRLSQIDTGANVDMLRVSGADPAALFVGKLVAAIAQLLILEVALAAGVTIFYDLKWGSVGFAALVGLIATIGIAAAGVLYSGLVPTARGRESLLPLLLLPALSPVMIGATQGLDAVVNGAIPDAWPWMAMLGIFSVIYVACGLAAYGAVLEDS